MPQSFWVSVATGLVVASALGTGGCLSGAACDTTDNGNPEEAYGGGSTANGVYQSSPWNQGYLDFPGGHRYAFVHGLGQAPASVDVYLAFQPDPDRAAPCAGNSCLISADDTLVHVKNDTCSEFWVRVVATAAPPSALSDGGD